MIYTIPVSWTKLIKMSFVSLFIISVWSQNKSHKSPILIRTSNEFLICNFENWFIIIRLIGIGIGIQSHSFISRNISKFKVVFPVLYEQNCKFLISIVTLVIKFNYVLYVIVILYLKKLTLFILLTNSFEWGIYWKL